MPDEHGFTALHHAARAGKVEIMIILVGHGADIHALNRNNNTPLHSAAYGNQPDAIQWLASTATRPGTNANSKQDLNPLLVGTTSTLSPPIGPRSMMARAGFT